MKNTTERHDTDGQATTAWVMLSAGARIAGVDRVTLHRALRSGALPYAKIAGRRFIAVADLETWREQRQARAGDRRAASR